jgi:hypothetical protein
VDVAHDPATGMVGQQVGSSLDDLRKEKPYQLEERLEHRPHHS